MKRCLLAFWIFCKGKYSFSVETTYKMWSSENWLTSSHSKHDIFQVVLPFFIFHMYHSYLGIKFHQNGTFFFLQDVVRKAPFMSHIYFLSETQCENDLQINVALSKTSKYTLNTKALLDEYVSAKYLVMKAR